MSSSSEEFEWGEKVPGLGSSYQRMRYRGRWYALGDCVHVRSDRVDPHVGKLMRLYEEDGKRKLRVRWFLREYELPLAVRSGLGENRNKRELFIAQGSVKGVENEILVETVLRKVTVLCTAKVPGRNPQPSQQLVDEAHYFFNRAYDAQQRKLVKMERIERGLASKLFNKPEWVVYEEIKSPISVADFEMVERKRPSPIAEGPQSNITDSIKFKSEFTDPKKFQSEYTDSKKLKSDFTDSKKLKSDFTDSKNLKSDFTDSKKLSDFTHPKKLKSEFMDSMKLKSELPDSKKFKSEFTDSKKFKSEFTDSKEFMSEL